MRVKGNHDFGTAHLLQKLLAQAVVSGTYASHLGVIQTRYARKAEVMGKAMEQHFPPEAHWQKPSGGLYYWAQLPQRIPTGPRSRLFKKAIAREVFYVPGSLCYANDPSRPRPDGEMRLSFGNAKERDIREGISRLGAVLRELS